MPFYKGVYYPDGSVPMSHADISALEVSSIDDVIGNIRAGGFVDTVANIAERDEKYPTPSEGFPIWLADAGCEQRYVGGQWVGYSEGMMPVPIQSAVPSGSGSTFKLLGVGGIEFTNCNSITLNNIFTNDFDNYKIIVNITSSTQATAIWGRFSIDGVASTVANGVRTGYYADSATVAVIGSASTSELFPIGIGNLPRNGVSEFHFMRPNKTMYPLFSCTSQYNNNSTLNGIVKSGIQINNSNAPAYDGINIRSQSNTAALLTGNIKVYGYN
jgi:hypothetical protein